MACQYDFSGKRGVENLIICAAGGIFYHGFFIEELARTSIVVLLKIGSEVSR